MPLLRGRDFRLLDSENAAKVIIVNETMAQKFWPNADPLGQIFSDGAGNYEVVGVARNTKYRDLREAPRMTMYLPLAQDYSPVMNLLLRTTLPPTDLIAPLRRQLGALDPALPVFNIRTLPEHIGRALYVERMQSLLLALFGSLALALTAVGLYGVMSYTVTQRTREIGIRMALGAQRQMLTRMFLQHGLVLTAIGVVFGLAAAAVLMRLMSSLLFNVRPVDPVTYTAVSAGLMATALLASYLPSRRAATIDPVDALRAE